MAEASDDPHLWLEEVTGERALEWVKECSAQAVAAVGGHLEETETYKRILAILDSKDKIPAVYRIGNDEQRYYDFWRDESHVQGIWRKTTLDSYRTPDPEWHTVIDVDALPPPEDGGTWVWHGYSLLDEGPDGAWDRALIKLSPGGSDADTLREFDLKTEKFVAVEDGGFAMPKAAKHRTSFRSRDELLVGTDFSGDGSELTDSGYPRVIKSWKRGTPLSDAVTVFEGEQTDVSVGQHAYYDRGFRHEFQRRSLTFYTSKQWYRSLPSFDTPAPEEATPFVEVPVPDDADFSTFADAATVELRTEWQPPGHPSTIPAGSFFTAPIADVMAGDWSKLVVLFEATPTASLKAHTGTKDFMVLQVLEDVRTQLRFWKYNGGGVWEAVEAPGSAVAVGEDVNLGADWPDADNSLWLRRSGFLVPDVREYASAADCCTSTEVMKSLPKQFNADGLIAEQHFAASADGTRIPYIILRREDLVMDGSAPTIVDAYGGFEIAMLPYYSGGAGAGWLERGGVKVVANIRGGGEYGPRWHQAAVKANRNKCFEDLEAVAQDLIARGVTSTPKLACIGGSNGGLLVGNAMVREVGSSLFGAIVCQVPLLDMRRYSKLLAGASWMAEYGDPDTDDWTFLRKYSPYHVLRHDILRIPEGGEEPATPPRDPAWRCPKTLIYTSTKDDRVHPGHARKMARALMTEAGEDAVPPGTVLYWENVEGGHGGAANNSQRAFMWSLTYEFLAKTLGL